MYVHIYVCIIIIIKLFIPEKVLFIIRICPNICIVETWFLEKQFLDYLSLTNTGILSRRWNNKNKINSLDLQMARF